MPRAIAVVLSFALGFLAACEDDEPGHDYISRGEEACEPIALSPETAPEECITWACAKDEALECATVSYGATCEAWADDYGCAIEDVIRVSCLQCENY
jgi:hypothetical protein